MKAAHLLVLASLAAAGQTTEVREIRFRFDPEPRVRPGETVSVQIQVWGEVTTKDGNKVSGRLRETANAKVASGQGWVSKPYRFQGSDDGGYVNTGASGFAQIFQSVSGQFVQKDAVLYTAPLNPGAYTIEAETKGKRGTATITVSADAPTRKIPEKQNFPPEPDNNRYRKLAEYWAPYIAQETWWQPKADIPTRFDFDGDWNGENNWENMDAGSSQAYVYYAAVETSTHWFLHYNFFHPRDYSDNCIAGTCHENDNEGIILTVRKEGGEFGVLELMETLAHNNVYSYTNDTRLRKGAHDIDAKIDFHDGHHPMVFLEAGGHGALAASARNSTFSASRKEFNSGTGNTFFFKGVAERAAHSNARDIGYDLIPIETAWWPRVSQSGEKTFDAPYDYQPYGGRPGAGRRYMGSFWGRKHGSNKAKPFWGWHDERTRRGKVLNTGQWALDPAYAVSRNITFPSSMPVDQTYIYNPFLGIGEPAVVTSTFTPSRIPEPTEPSVAPPALSSEPAEGSCQFEAVVDGSVLALVHADALNFDTLSGQPVSSVSHGCTIPMPDLAVTTFDVHKNKGRGTVKVLEPPTAANFFTGKIQIDDPDNGADQYVIVVRWKL